MLSTNNLGLQYGKRVLFDEVNIKFTRGNCYGVIGANGAGKTTLLKILSGMAQATRGSVNLEPGNRMAVLKQDHFEFEDHMVLDTVIMGHKKLYDIMVEKNAIYNNPDATDAESMRAADLELEYGEMGGWTAENDAETLLSNMGVKEKYHDKLMKDLPSKDKVKVLLAQALFGDPDILLLDEPTNDIDVQTANWLADFLADFKNTVIVVSHDRYFLDMVCTHMVDIDFGEVRIFTGNYTFWYETSQIMAKQVATKNKKVASRQKELQDFIRRFSANASKSRQATSRKKALEKLNLEEIRPSGRKYPFIHFKPERNPGNEILKVEKVSYQNSEGNWLFKDVTFTIEKDDKIALLSPDSSTTNAFYQILAGKLVPTSGTVTFGVTIKWDYLPTSNDEFFSGANDLDLLNWLRQYSEDKDEQFIRGFLGRMFFSGEDVYKLSSVLSGGEKVRCMLAKIMLNKPNFLLMEEPTNHLDLESITALDDGFKEFPGNMILTSHDHSLMQSVSNRVIELTPNGIIDQLCSFDEYINLEKYQTMREALLV